MLFRRKKPATLAEKAREFLWPRKGFTRGVRYLSVRILRLSSSPHSIAIGVAAGAASSATPFVGFHILLALALAYVLSGNMIAAGAATTLANPLTIPVILAVSYEIGVVVLGMDSSRTLQGDEMLHMLRQLDFGSLWQPLLKPLLVGMVPLASVSAVVFYFAAFYAARLFQFRRRNRLLQKTALRSAEDADAL